MPGWSDFPLNLVDVGAALLLLSYALQKPIGRSLLWSAYVANLVVGFLVLREIVPKVGPAFEQAFATGRYDSGPINALQSGISAVQLLAVIPSMLLVAAYYLAWARIKRGEIPPPIAPPVPIPPPPANSPSP